jgi:hypothetical protein
MDILGADLLTNAAVANAPDTKMADIQTVDFPAFSDDNVAEAPSAPRLFPSLNEVGQMETSDGFQNMNADSFIQATSASSRRMSDEHLMKEKYEYMRKFERLQRAGVPMRKRFTLDSPLEEMRMELEFMRREKQMDQTIKQFCDWYITGMSAMEWGSKNMSVMKAFGLQLDGLSESAQMNVVDMEEDFEELYELYGDKMKMHPLVRIPIRTCMMVYMVHLTNQMARKAPIPNIDEVLRTNPDIARQLATAAMQQQTRDMKSSAQAAPAVSFPPPQAANPMAGLASYMSSMMHPPPPQATQNPGRVPASIKSPVKIQRPNAQPQAAFVAPPPAPAREMKASNLNLDDLLAKVNADSKKVSVPSSASRKGGSTGKNSVAFKL